MLFFIFVSGKETCRTNLYYFLKMKKILFFSLILLAIACEESEPLPPPIPEVETWEPFFAGKESGDSIEFYSFNPGLKFPLLLDTISNLIFTDSMYLDLDTNGFPEFILVYREEYWNAATKPSYQCFEIHTPHGVQLPKDEFYGGDLVYRCEGGKVIDASLPWRWDENFLLCYRQNNISMGLSQDTFYLVFQQPWYGDRKFGWIRMKLELDDYYFKSLQIDGYAMKDM